MNPAGTSNYIIRLTGNRLHRRTFLLGNESGFVIYLPVEENTRDATLMRTKWSGASGFGRHYLAAARWWAELDGRRIALDRLNLVEFSQELDRAVRVFAVEGRSIRQTYWVPDGIQVVAVTLEADGPASFVAEPQFDMRYYQAFNTDFTGYAAAVDAGALVVTNHIINPTSTLPEMHFAARVLVAHGDLHVEMLPAEQRLRHKTYLVDEHRERLIQSAYSLTHEQAPDEAPIWDQYSTQVYAPALLHGSLPATLLFGFGIHPPEVAASVDQVCSSLPAMRKRQQEKIADRLQLGQWTSGDELVDRAYAQVLTRFNTCLVARGATEIIDQGASNHQFDAILAGNKYFLDAWKRDENISLGALLVTSDFATVRAILDDTWRFQDERTGRLPQIIRFGEPVVYYSSDGTLWALRRLYQYSRASGDLSLLDAKYSMVEHFFTASLDFAQRGLLPSGRIIDPAYLWETWEDTAYTPRDGYPVEIELLWLTVLSDYLPTMNDRNPALAARLQTTLEEGRATFPEFYLDGYLADSLSYDWEPRTILTPNGYMAFSLRFPLPADLARSMVMLGRDQLAGRVGIRSLAPRDWSRVLTPEFVNDPHHVQGKNMASVGLYNYHRGVEWLWLNQFFVVGELDYGDPNEALERYIDGQVHEALSEGGVGGLSELYDTRGPLGADFQAWSMASFMDSLHAFAGVQIDAVARRLEIRPALPDRWPELNMRRQIGQTPFDLRCHRDGAIQVVEIQPLDRIPPGITLHLGVRLPAGATTPVVSVNGKALSSDAIQLRAATPDLPAEAWIELPFTGSITARFQPWGRD